MKKNKLDAKIIFSIIGMIIIISAIVISKSTFVDNLIFSCMESIIGRGLDRPVWIERFTTKWLANIVVIAELILILIYVSLKISELYDVGKNIDYWKELCDDYDIKKIFSYTAIWAILAWSYILLNDIHIGDASSIYIPQNVYAVDDRWFVNYIYPYIMGRVNSSWLSGIWSYIFMAIGLVALINSLEIHAKLSKFVICGLCVTNVSILCHQLYVGGSFVGPLAFMFATLAIFELKKDKLVWFIIYSVMSCATYGAYIGTIMTLIIYMLIVDILKNDNWKLNLKKIIKNGIMAILAILSYWIMLKILAWVTNTTPANNTNYMGKSQVHNILNYSDIFKYIWGASVNVLKYCVGMSGTLPICISVLVPLILIVGIILCIIGIKNNKIEFNWMNLCLLIILVLCLFITTNLIEIIIHGTEPHGLMRFGYGIHIVVVAKVIDKIIVNQSDSKQIRFFSALGSLCIAIFLLESVIMANAMYTHIGHQSEVAKEIANRVISDIEHVEDFEGNETVVFVGMPNKDIYYSKIHTEDVYILKAALNVGWWGFVNTFHTAAWNEGFFENIMESNLDYKCYSSIDRAEQEGSCLDSEEIERIRVMGYYPRKDSVIKINDKIIIRFME